MEQYCLTNWKLFLGDLSNAWQKDFADQGWKKVTVPHDWSITQDFTKDASSGTGYLPGGIGWYRCHFSAAELGDLSDRVLQIRFEGVYKNADVWVNGYHLGYRPSGYSSFQYDLTDLAAFNNNDEFVIAVRVDHSDIADSRWYNGSGITRPVYLAVLDQVYVDRYDVTFETEAITDRAAKVNASAILTNALDTETQVTVEQTLKEIGGESFFKLGEETVSVPAHGKRAVVFAKELAEPKLWSAEIPALYQLETKVTAEGKESHYLENVGIRKFVFDPNKGFLLNNQPATKLKGVNLHEDAGCFGTAVPTAVWLRRLFKIKEAGGNAIRMGHNPHAQNLYDLCDALGFFVIDEAFDEWENPKNKWCRGHNIYPPKYEGYAKDFPVWHEKDLVDMVRRNKNHASVIAWSIGNEIDYPNDPYANQLFNEMTGNNDANKPAEERIYNPNRPDTRRATVIARRLTDIVHREDATRPVTLAAAFPELSSQTGLIDVLDLVGYNYKENLYEDHHKRFPDKPFYSSESKHSYSQWLAVKNNNYISGHFIWTGVDFLGEARGVFPRHGTYRGLIDLCGYPTIMFYKRKSWWVEAATGKLYTRPYDGCKTEDPWTPVFRKWNYRDGEDVEIRLYTNADQFTLKMGQTDIPMTFDETEGYYTAVTHYQNVPLTLEAKKDGKPITDLLEAVGESCQLMANVWQAPVKWSRFNRTYNPDKVIHQIELTFIDNKGRATSDERIVTFSSDDAAFLGFENGNVDDITNYVEKWRRSFNGRMICYVQTDKGQKGSVKFSVEGFSPLVVSL